MCSIGGVFSKNGQDVYPFLLELLFAQQHRGSDAFGISVGKAVVKSNELSGLRQKFLDGSFGLCHSLLSITGRSVQPLCAQNGAVNLVHNGQIYNFKQIGGKGLSNDSQSIINFLGPSPQKNVLPFFKKAVGSFAVGFSHGSCLYAFRDAVGVRPIWFGQNSEIFAFASEPNALKKLNISFPSPLF